MVQPVIFSEQINHSDIRATSNWTAVSAGFCYLDKDKLGSVIIPMSLGSESLNLKPRRGDDIVLGHALNNMTDGSFYMDFDNAIYPDVEKEEDLIYGDVVCPEELKKYKETFFKKNDKTVVASVRMEAKKEVEVSITETDPKNPSVVSERRLNVKSIYSKEKGWVEIGFDIGGDKDDRKR